MMIYLKLFERFLQDRRGPIYENLQLSNKLYFDNSKISKKDRDEILKITKGDNFTKFICDIWYFLLNSYVSLWRGELWEVSEYLGGPSSKKAKWDYLKMVYDELKGYNSNIFPIEEFNYLGLDAKPEDFLINNSYYSGNNNPYFRFLRNLFIRSNCVKMLNKMPSFAKRNLKETIRKPIFDRDKGDYQEIGIKEEMASIIQEMKKLDKFDDERKNRVLSIVFSSGNDFKTALTQLKRIKNPDTLQLTRDDILKMVGDDLEVVYDRNDVMVVKANQVSGIQKIGGNTMWCYADKEKYSDSSMNSFWIDYSEMGPDRKRCAYVIVDFREPQTSRKFMHVLTGPSGSYRSKILFDMFNNNVEDPMTELERIFGKDYLEIVESFWWKIK